MLKKIIIGLVVLIVIVGIGLGYLWSNLDNLIRSAVEKYGTAATQTAVALDHVKLSITSGEGSLGGLSVDNPKGFNSNVKAFYLGSVAVSVDVNSIQGTGPIIIKEITIEKPQVNYEITIAGDSNLSALQKNAQNYANSMSGKTNTTPDQPVANTEQKASRKIIINDLYVRDGQIGISTQMIKDKNFAAPLPEIHLTGIGKNSGGATAAQVADQLLSSITASAGKVATSEIAKNLAGFKDLSTLKGTASDATTNVKSQLKGLFGN